MNSVNDKLQLTISLFLCVQCGPPCLSSFGATYFAQFLLCVTRPKNPICQHFSFIYLKAIFLVKILLINELLPALLQFLYSVYKSKSTLTRRFWCLF